MNQAANIILCAFRCLCIPIICCLYSLPARAQHLSNKEVLIVFNSADSESKKLAEFYQAERKIPTDQILGLDLPKKRDISRAEFDTKILRPLRDHFDNKEWWIRGRNRENQLIPTQNKIRAIVLMRGIPLRIAAEPKQKNKDEPINADPIAPRDEASVDSELALFGVETLPSLGVLKNTFFNSEFPLSEVNAPHMVLVSRIDSPTYAICKKMITDAIETEKHGLWGRAYVDIANKFPQGDQWLESIVSMNTDRGIPTVTDRFNDTLPKYYPMSEAAIYYGWYDWHVSGPFQKANFQFRPGAIAVHLHSFSAEQLSHAHKNWAAPLLVRGATATVGNVYEPYLHLTHHFNILQDRLLRGWTFAEASWAAIPTTSWQSVALGDPLYRPFQHLDGTGDIREEDREFRALRAASREWPNDSTKRRTKLAEAAEKLSSGSLSEALALEYLHDKDIPNAQTWFNKAKTFFTKNEDKIRQDMNLIAIERARGKKNIAISLLRTAKAEYGSIPESQALSGWLDILDPPAPPIANPNKIPK